MRDVIDYERSFTCDHCGEFQTNGKRVDSFLNLCSECFEEWSEMQESEAYDRDNFGQDEAESVQTMSDFQ